MRRTSDGQLGRLRRFIPLTSPAVGTKTLFQPTAVLSPCQPGSGYEFASSSNLLKAHKMVICRGAVNSFGHIAKSSGPQDVS